MANVNLSFKLITDNKNTFFTNNKFISAESLPVEGDFIKGDIIVNIGETADTEAMWVCIESGNPGVWEVVGAGGGSSNSLIGLKNNVTLESDANEVEIGIEGFNKNNDMMTVYKNSVYMMEGKDYEFNEAGDRIVAMNGEVFKAGTVFGFVVLKEVPVVEEGEVIDGRVIEDGSIGLDKLDTEVKEAIEAAGNIDLSGYVSEEELEAKGYLTEHQDLSGYATKEELNNIDMSGKQDKVDNSLVTNDKSIVGAINELFQSANNGKELIASAIGEPLNSEDTFSAMSNDINGLLSTFKTNMMNNGITVESGDKFKALIDKIATLADNEGKGIQYVEAHLEDSITATGADLKKTYIFSDLNINFEPTFLIFGNKDNGPLLLTSGTYDDIMYTIKNIDGGFTITYKVSAGLTTVTVTNFKCYAIGIGEEDTTLRDSLASILTEEGVSVTEEDDMASLITKVDEEFDESKQQLANITNKYSGF